MIDISTPGVRFKFKERDVCVRVSLLIKLCFFCAYELCRVLFVVFE
jgi:hypothetical protein